MNGILYKGFKKVSFLTEINERIRSFQGRPGDNQIAHEVMYIQHDVEYAVDRDCNEIGEALSNSLIRWNTIQISGQASESGFPEILRHLNSSRVLRKARAAGLLPRRRLATGALLSGSFLAAAALFFGLCLMFHSALSFPSRFKLTLISPVFLLNACWVAPVSAWGAFIFYDRKQSRSQKTLKALAAALKERRGSAVEKEIINEATNQLYYSPIPLAVVVPGFHLLDEFSGKVLRGFLQDTERLNPIRTLWFFFESRGRLEASKMLSELEALGKAWKGRLSRYRLASPRQDIPKAA